MNKLFRATWMDTNKRIRIAIIVRLLFDAVFFMLICREIDGLSSYYKHPPSPFFFSSHGFHKYKFFSRIYTDNIRSELITL